MPDSVITHIEQVTTGWLTGVLAASGALTRGGVASFELDAGQGNWSSNAAEGEVGREHGLAHGSAGDVQNPLARSLRDLVLRWTPERVNRNQLDRLYRLDHGQ